MTEARFSITRKTAAGDLVTVRGDTSLELVGNFEFIWGEGSFLTYGSALLPAEMKAEQAQKLLNDAGLGPAQPAATDSRTSAAFGAGSDKPASAGIIAAHAKRLGVDPSTLAGKTPAELKALK